MMRFFLFAVFLLAACSGRQLTQANLDRIDPGMNEAQVEAILGKPDHIETSETLGLSGTAYLYGSGVRVIFLNHAVRAKQGSFKGSFGKN